MAKSICQRVGDDLYENLACSIEGRITDFGIDKRAAAWISGIAIKKICEELGGMNVYFPKQTRRLIEIRDEEIFIAFGTVPLYELAAKHQLSEMRIRQITWAFNAEIYKKFKGNNQAALADEYGVPEERIVRIITREEWK